MQRYSLLPGGQLAPDPQGSLVWWWEADHQIKRNHIAMDQLTARIHTLLEERRSMLDRISDMSERIGDLESELNDHGL